MSDSSGLNQSPRSGLYRTLPCQNIATADDGAWQSYSDKSKDRRLMSPTKEEKSRTNSAVKKIARSPEAQNVSLGFTEDRSEFSEAMIYGTGGPSDPGSGRWAGKEIAERIQPDRYRLDRVQPESYSLDVGRPARGVVGSKSTPSFAKYKTDGVMHIWNEIDGTVVCNTQTGVSSSATSPTVSNGPLTPGPSRRSAIPVRNHRRSSSASANDESSSLNFMLYLANENGKGKNALTPSSQHILHNTPNKSTMRQKNELSGINTSKQLSSVTSRRLLEAGSRTHSPSGRLAHMTFRQPAVPPSGTPLSRPTSARTRPNESQLRPSRIPRSQGQSRDTSPSRSSDGSEKQSKMSFPGRVHPANYNALGGASLLSGRVLQTGSEMEQTLTDALVGSLSVRREDAASETSSVSSEFSQFQMNSAMSPMDIISMMSSASWSERRQGLFGLQHLMKSNGVLNPFELKKVTELFTRMFHDPQPKVFNAFLETLVDVLEMHSEDMVDWLYTCLSRLLVKLTSDLLGSVQARIYKAMRTICEHFTFESQMAALARFIAEHTQASNLRVRLAILDHVHEMALMTEPCDFVGSESCQQMALCIVQWTNEQKSSEVRKAAQGTVVALFNLNTPEFSAVLSRLPRSIQDCARRILHSHMFAVSQQMETQSGSETSSAGGQFMNSAIEMDQLSSADYISSLKKTAEDIQNLSSLS